MPDALTPPRDVREWIARLRAAGELHEVTAPVSSELEITEITDRVTKERGPALLFSNVVGSDYPVLVNQFGSDARLAMAFGVDDIDEVAQRITGMLQLTKPPKGLRAKLATLRTLGGVARSVPPRIVRASKAPCQEVVTTGTDVNLDELPILGCWPEDGGRYVTLPLVFTKDREGNRNCGMYRVQQYDKNTCGMHWQIHKGAADDWRHMPPDGRLEVAVAIGTDPIVTYSASCPLPKDIDEMVFSGFARGRRVDMVQCRTVDLQVPANAEFILEGYIQQGELRTEGPFGDHTGYYSLADEYPVFHVTAITRRREPVYCATVVGVPDHEDKWMGKATERIFLPLLQMVQHEVVDYDLPSEGVFHGCCIIAIRKRFPGHARKAMHAIWGTALLSLTKTVIVVDEDVDVHDYAAVAARVRDAWDPARDCLWSEGPIDVLDHAPTRMGIGGKLGIDATRTWPSELAPGEEDAAVRRRSETVDAAALAELVREVGGTNHRLVPDAGLVIVAIDKQRGGQGREVLELMREAPAAEALRLVVVLDDYVDVDDLHAVAFRAFGNTDPVRDAVHAPLHGGPLGIDATIKLREEGYVRDWPSDIVMTEAIKQRVDDRWAEYGIPTPGARTSPTVGLAEGERRIPEHASARGPEGAGNAEMARDGMATAGARD
ncbi:MAG: menaquinone biosynthesis decarboxylase [Thermoleophilia bacterium]|nr:menaquinone biosynthesis decarboxylase [Thermoleophilia bacterium]